MLYFVYGTHKNYSHVKNFVCNMKHPTMFQHIILTSCTSHKGINKGNTHDHKINPSKIHNDTQVIKQIITFLETILQQNYFLFENYINRKKGISMGSPISDTIAEIFLQHIENTHLKKLLDTKSIIFCTRYVDDIPIIYDTQCVNSNTIHEYMNQVHPNLQLNPTHESNN